MTRKIDAMHKYFGVAPGEHCKGCCHCISGQYRGKNYRKCDVYGMTHSEATDWAQSWLACGLYNKPYSGERIMGRALYDATNRRTAERREALGLTRADLARRTGLCVETILKMEAPVKEPHCTVWSLMLVATALGQSEAELIGGET